jgi:hypothetical protein
MNTLILSTLLIHSAGTVVILLGAALTACFRESP